MLFKGLGLTSEQTSSRSQYWKWELFGQKDFSARFENLRG